MTAELLKNTEEKMKKVVEALRNDYSSIRAGRANPALLDKIKVEYYGVSTPLNQVANISAPEARLLLIQPWDKNILSDVEKAILKSDLDLNPNNDGNVIRIAIPQLTEERRKELVKLVKKKAEEYRVVIRNYRRDANDEIKKMEKKGNISEDEMHLNQDNVQELTNEYIEKIDAVLKSKEEEIMEV
jgi:ribosome recycling factor